MDLLSKRSVIVGVVRNPIKNAAWFTSSSLFALEISVPTVVGTAVAPMQLPEKNLKICGYMPITMPVVLRVFSIIKTATRIGFAFGIWR